MGPECQGSNGTACGEKEICQHSDEERPAVGAPGLVPSIPETSRPFLGQSRVFSGRLRGARRIRCSVHSYTSGRQFPRERILKPDVFLRLLLRGRAQWLRLSQFHPVPFEVFDHCPQSPRRNRGFADNFAARFN